MRADPCCFLQFPLHAALIFLNIDNDCLSLSQKIIEVAAVRLDKLERYESDVENSKLQQYIIEYYMIRAHLVWSTRL